jgi:hypothetical protein
MGLTRLAATVDSGRSSPFILEHSMPPLSKILGMAAAAVTLARAAAVAVAQESQGGTS